MTLDDLEKSVKVIKEFMKVFSDRKISFEEARILLVNQLHITMGEATDRLEIYERISDTRLER